jgi:hypothetical protein
MSFASNSIARFEARKVRNNSVALFIALPIDSDSVNADPIRNRNAGAIFEFYLCGALTGHRQIGANDQSVKSVAEPERDLPLRTCTLTHRALFLPSDKQSLAGDQREVCLQRPCRRRALISYRDLVETSFGEAGQ